MTKSILFCKCVYCDYLTDDVQKLVESLILSDKNDTYITDDLCGLVSGKDKHLLKFANKTGLKIIACHSRAVRWLLFQSGISENLLNTFSFFNIRETPLSEIFDDIEVVVPDEIKEKLNNLSSNFSIKNKKTNNSNTSPKSERKNSIEIPGDKERPWFPVIDYDRCNECGACIDFCLFGVYQKNNTGKIAVANPGNCKDNCPACARVCPHQAVIFPKYDKAPINGGEDKDVARKPHKTPIFALSGDQLYKTLSQRGKKKKNKSLYK